MDISTAKGILEGIKSSQIMGLKRELYDAAIRYAHIRVKWRLATPEERKSMGKTRTAAHNALIDSCNILSRRMRESGESIEWRELLGNDRREIGDFGCYLHCLFGLSAR